MCFSFAFPLSRVRARRYPFARLPDGVQTFYVVDLATANSLLATHFPATGPGSDFTVVAYDIEYHGSPHSSRAMRTLHVPLPRSQNHFLRLLAIARDGVVIVVDLWAIGAIPPRIVEIFGNGAIIKVGVGIRGDSVFCTRHFAVPVYNAWELSQLWKCMHPVEDVAPLTSHISVDDMARIALGVRVDKGMQTSAWNATILSVDQIKYSILDAYILLPIYHAIRREYDMGTWPLFSTASFACNVDIVQGGAVVAPGPNTTGTEIRVWGVGCPIPGVNDGDWAPTHPVLDAYRSGIYNDCRSMDCKRFLSRELGSAAGAMRNVLFFLGYRLCRWVYAHNRDLVIVFTFVVLPAVSYALYTRA